MKLFDAIVGGIISYGAEVWGWKEREEIEKLEEKYIRWILGVDGKTPGYIVKEELKREERSTTLAVGAMRREEKMKNGEEGSLLRECWAERMKDKEQLKMTEWSRQRREYFQKCGVEEAAVERWMECGEPWIELVTQKDQESKKLRRTEKIEQSKYNRRYKEIRATEQPGYIKEGKRRGAEFVKRLARIRCGSEEMANKYWLGGEKIGCKLCEVGIDTLEHAAKECEGMWRWEGEINEIADENGRGYEWIKEWLERKKDTERSRVDKDKLRN